MSTSSIRQGGAAVIIKSSVSARYDPIKHVMPVCLQAPVTFKLSEPTGQPGYLVTVFNKHSFISTEGLLFDFRVMADGVPIRQEGDEGWTHFDIAHIPAQVSSSSSSSVVRGQFECMWLCVQ